MRKLLSTMLLVPVFALAEPVTTEKKVVCDTLEVIVEAFIKGEPKEKIFWIGQGTSTTYALLLNEKTKTWSFIQFNAEVACVLGVGESFKILGIGAKI